MDMERREHTRYDIRNAICVNGTNVFQVVDISVGGFRIKCHPHSVIPQEWVADIINSVVPLETIPIKKIWVSLIENGNAGFPSILFAGARFGRLRTEQKSKLMQLLMNISHN